MFGPLTQLAILALQNQRDKVAQNPHEKSRFAGDSGRCANKCEERWTQAGNGCVDWERGSAVLAIANPQKARAKSTTRIRSVK